MFVEEVVTGSKTVGLPGKRTTRMAILGLVVMIWESAISENVGIGYTSNHGTSDQDEEARKCRKG